MIELNIIVCVDDEYGMLFNSRRQSRDFVVIEKIIEILKGKVLWMSEYSFPLFEDCGYEFINIDEHFISKAAQKEYCFVENISIAPYENRIDSIILFRWNRRYPADLYFDVNLDSWHLIETTQLSGKSHETITMEVYTK